MGPLSLVSACQLAYANVYYSFICMAESGSLVHVISLTMGRAAPLSVEILSGFHKNRIKIIKLIKKVSM